MTSILPSIKDRYRNLRNGKKKFTGQVIRFDGETRTVIAEVYGSTVEEMRIRKNAVAELLAKMENS